MRESLHRTVISEIRSAMFRKGITQQRLGELLHHGQSWVGRRLTGEVPLTLPDVEAIAAALDVHPSTLTNPQNGA